MASDDTAGRERAQGIGGVFLRARDPEALAAWYEHHLGLPREPGQAYAVFTASRDAHVWSAFPEGTDYWPAGKQAMVNFVVRDLDAMLDQLRAAGVPVDEDVHDLPGIGRFGWAVDPEGNRFELWEPASGS
jgi:predicted enzyme related to lactoylglutathione lyase